MNSRRSGWRPAPDVKDFVDLHGNESISSITTRTLEQHRDWLTSRISLAAADHYLAVIGLLFSYAVDREYIKISPYTKVRKMRIPEKIYEYLSWEEAGSVLQHVLHPPYKAAVGLALYAGLRSSECRSLRWDDIDFSSKEIGVVNTSSFTTKSGKARVTILLPQMEKLLDFDRVHELVVTSPLVTSLFKPATYNMLNDAWRVSRKKAGRPALRFHDLRASFATELLRHFPPAIAQQILGHSSVRTTMKHYSRIDPRRAVREVISSHGFSHGFVG